MRRVRSGCAVADAQPLLVSLLHQQATIIPARAVGSDDLPWAADMDTTCKSFDVQSEHVLVALRAATDTEVDLYGSAKTGLVTEYSNVDVWVRWNSDQASLLRRLTEESCGTGMELADYVISGKINGMAVDIHMREDDTPDAPMRGTSALCAIVARDTRILRLGQAIKLWATRRLIGSQKGGPRAIKSYAWCMLMVVFLHKKHGLRVTWNEQDASAAPTAQLPRLDVSAAQLLVEFWAFWKGHFDDAVAQGTMLCVNATKFTIKLKRRQGTTWLRIASPYDRQPYTVEEVGFKRVHDEFCRVDLLLSDSVAFREAAACPAQFAAPGRLEVLLWVLDNFGGPGDEQAPFRCSTSALRKAANWAQAAEPAERERVRRFCRDRMEGDSGSTWCQLVAAVPAQLDVRGVCRRPCRCRSHRVGGSVSASGAEIIDVDVDACAERILALPHQATATARSVRVCVMPRASKGNTPSKEAIHQHRACVKQHMKKLGMRFDSDDGVSRPHLQVLADDTWKVMPGPGIVILPNATACKDPSSRLSRLQMHLQQLQSQDFQLGVRRELAPAPPGVRDVDDLTYRGAHVVLPSRRSTAPSTGCHDLLIDHISKRGASEGLSPGVWQRLNIVRFDEPRTADSDVACQFHLGAIFPPLPPSYLDVHVREPNALDTQVSPAIFFGPDRPPCLSSSQALEM